MVGVDDSEASVAALRWAVEQARALGTSVLAVHAWEPATAAGFAPYAPSATRPTAADQRGGLPGCWPRRFERPSVHASAPTCEP
ncbi:universal stress protein [Streptomyces sp. HD]|uniref:universal stress protein n=1 Tax=Streptomyces sp. HD TaxID=3020892 RepID=UPI00232AF800|nr:universal stress protein [Streptomyces sp. HD]MDC0765367.1 universal stress protein [Streptomyces sp. HD]